MHTDSLHPRRLASHPSRSAPTQVRTPPSAPPDMTEPRRSPTLQQSARTKAPRSRCGVDQRGRSRARACARHWPRSTARGSTWDLPPRPIPATSGADRSHGAGGRKRGTGATKPACEARATNRPKDTRIWISNDEVERPPDAANSAARRHTVSPHPRRLASHLSRSARTIVRLRLHNWRTG